MNDNTVTFICDTPPGAVFVLTVPRGLTQRQAFYLQEAFSRAMKSGSPSLIVIEDGYKLEQLTPSQQWPDAEFCAA